MNIFYMRLIVLLSVFGFLFSPWPAMAFPDCSEDDWILSGNSYSPMLVKRKCEKLFTLESLGITFEDVPGCDTYWSFEVPIWTLLDIHSCSSVDIWPDSGDPMVQTTYPIIESKKVNGGILELEDVDTSEYGELEVDFKGYSAFRAGSLMDLCVYEYRLDILIQFMDYCPNDPYDPDDNNKLFLYDIDPITLFPAFRVMNEAPEANPVVSGTLNVNNTLTFDANAHDPDGGNNSLHYLWTITDRPSGSTGDFNNPEAASPSLDLVSPEDMGEWAYELQLADNEGEVKVFGNNKFTVENQPPTLKINGMNNPSLTVNVPDPISLKATPAKDADGEDITWVWDIALAPPLSPIQAQSNYSTSQSMTIPPSQGTGAHEVGDWEFVCTASDGKKEVKKTAYVTVTGIEPQINIEGDTMVKVGEAPIYFETTILEDGYGNPIKRFQWDILQAPVSAGVGLQSNVSNGPSITIPENSGHTTIAHAGTWKFRLEVEDEAGMTAEDFVKVLVHADPVVVLTGPHAHPTPSEPLELKGGASYDPDSLDHVSVDAVDITPGITEFVWEVIEAPAWFVAHHGLGPVIDALNVDGSNDNLVIPPGYLMTGNWVFKLTVKDWETDQASQTHLVQVLDDTIPPTAIVSSPQEITLNSQNKPKADVWVDGSASFDLDTLLLNPPNKGITHYLWDVYSGPSNCGAVPDLPDGPNQEKVKVFSKDNIISMDCQGPYQVGLTVTDDDIPFPKTQTAVASVIVGNCGQNICVEYPTKNNYQTVLFSDQTDVIVYYFINSALYESPVTGSGLHVKLEIAHESDPHTPVYDQTWDEDMLPGDKGKTLEIHWFGYDNAKQRPKPGKYSIRMMVADNAGNPTSVEAYEEDAIHIEVIDVEVNSTSDRYIKHEALVNKTDTVDINYQITGALPGAQPYDQIRFRVFEQPTDTMVFEQDLPMPFGGSHVWDGLDSGGVVVSTGVYEMEMEVFSNGASLSVSNRQSLYVYHMGISHASAPVTSVLPGLFMSVNTDDDNYNNVSDLNESHTQENDLIKAAFLIEPPMPGTWTLSVKDPLLKIWKTDQKSGQVGLPYSLVLPAATVPSQLVMEAVAPGQSQLQMTFDSFDGLLSATTSFAFTAVEGHVMEDLDADFAITSADAPKYFVKPGLWEAAFRLWADASGPVGSLFNDTDEIGLLPPNYNPNHFVGRDGRAFYFQITNADANKDPAVAETILNEFEWFTLKSTSPVVHDDRPPTNRSLSLIETGPDTGVFASKAVMLVTNPVDLSTHTNTGLIAAPFNRVYDQQDFRLRMIDSIDSFVTVQYRPQGAAGPVMQWHTPVFQRNPDERRYVNVRIFNFQDPFNLGIAAIPQADIDISTEIMKQIYVVAGVKTNFTYNPATDIIPLPFGSTVNLNAVASGIMPGAYNTWMPSPDLSALIGLVRSVEPAAPANADTLYLVYVSGFVGSIAGVSFPDGWTAAATGARNFVFSSDPTIGANYVEPHEAGHMFLNETLTAAQASGAAPGWANGGHYGGPQDTFNLMYPSGPGGPLTIQDDKRLWNDTFHIILQIDTLRSSRFIKGP